MSVDTTDILKKKWAPVLEDKKFEPIKDDYKKASMAVILENQAIWNKNNKKTLAALSESETVEKTVLEKLEEAINEAGSVDEFYKATLSEAAPTNASNDIGGASTGNIQGFDPVLISMLRRSMPQMIAFDVAGVQPMRQPTGLIFALKARASAEDGNLLNDAEILFNEAITSFSGKGTHTGDDPSVLNDATPGTYTSGVGLTTLEGEALGDGSQNWSRVGMTIEKTSVTARTRALRADFTTELQQDLRAVHGLDAEKELINILSQEVMFEINREVVRDLYRIAQIGAQSGTTATGIFDLDTDSNGRWSVEKFKGLIFQLEREANRIAVNTRRGKGNILMCSQDIASALHLAGVLDYTPALQTAGLPDAANQTYVGVMNGGMKVYVDPYLNDVTNNFAVVGFKGANQMDCGYFYCPYVAAELYRVTDGDRMQPSVGIKTRYGKVTNPFANASGTPGDIVANANRYYRKLKVTNIL